jgi:hypothetical protein
MNNNLTVVQACSLKPELKKAFQDGNYLYVITGEVIYRKISGKVGEIRSIIPSIKVFPSGLCMATNYSYRVGQQDLIELTLGEFYSKVEPIYQALGEKPKLTSEEKAAYESLSNLLGF